MHVCVCICAHMHVCVHTCVSVCMCLRAYVQVCVCACMRACVCVCISIPPSKWVQKLLSPTKSNLQSKSKKMTLTAFVVSKSFFLKVIEHLLAKSFFQTIAEVAEQAFQSVPATTQHLTNCGSEQALQSTQMVFWTLGCLQKSWAAGKECKGEVLKGRWELNEDDLKEKQGQLVFDPLFSM